VDAHGMLVRIIITHGTTADYTQVNRLIEGIAVEQLLADRRYDSDAIVINKACKSSIPPRKNRKKTLVNMLIFIN
jgi:IS5 family transposase